MKSVLKRIWEWWKPIGLAIGRFQTKVIISIFYFLIISPFGLIMRLFGWDPLRVRKSKVKAGTNWQDVKQPEPDLESLRRQS